MKKLIPLLAMVAAMTSFAQDHVVNYNNSNLSSPPDRLVRNPAGAGLTGTNYQAVLLYGTPGGSLSPAQAPARFRVSTTLSPGTWQGGDRTLTGLGNTPGTQVQMQVAVFDISSFANYAAAVAGGGILGRSALFTYTIPTPPLGPGATDIVTFGGFSIVPEPSVIGLGLVGAAALFMLRRRKAS